MNDVNKQEVQAQKLRAQMEALTKIGLCEQQVERLTNPDKLVEIYDGHYADSLLRFASACNKAAQKARQHAEVLQGNQT